MGLFSWYCIYTKPKKEDYVASLLSDRLGLEVFNPKVKKRKVVKGRYIDTEEELFPCYIFSRFDPKIHYHTIRYTRGVRRVVGGRNGSLYPVSDVIINAVKSRMVDGFVKLVPASKFRPGERVVVKDGPFQGLDGIFLEELSSKDRVIILLNLIKRQVKLEIDAGSVEALD